jgi:hypothetical protein
MRTRRDSLPTKQTRDALSIVLTCGLSQRTISYYLLPSTTPDRQDSQDSTDHANTPAQTPADPVLRRVERQQCQERIAALRQEGKTWSEIAATVGLSMSRVRSIYASSERSLHVPVSDAAILSNLRQYMESTNQPPTRRAFARWRERIVSPATVENRFGSWQRAVEEACGPQQKVDDAAILDNLRAYAAATGRAPTSRAYDVWEQHLVGHRAIERHFGSWQQAVDLAGAPDS